LGDQIVAQEIAQLWQEYEDATTPEALLVKDLDKFEMIVQAMEYEKCWYNEDILRVVNFVSYSPLPSPLHF
jgi:5'-deoxynucleotidase YfbR-like HD superfamily hydrolase